MSGKPINYMDISSCDDDDVYQVPDKDDDDDVVVTQTKAGGAKKKKNRLQSTAPASDSHSATRPTPTLQAPPPAPVVVANDSTTEDAPLFLAPTRAPRHGTSLPPLAYYDVSSEKFVGAAKGFRQAVWQHTAQIGEMGGYAVESEHGREGLWFDLKPYVRASVDGVAKFSLQRDRLPPLIAPRRGHISVFNADCLHAARRLAEEGLYPLVADAGSRAHFGGNYKGGARAQEEEMCRRSTLAFAFNKVVMPDNRNTSFYPLEPADAIYVPDVVVFREDVKSQYSLTKKPFRVAFGIIAAYCRPPLDSTGTRLTGDILAATRDMIRTFYLMAASKGHRALVIVPVGCGAFQNPASHIAELFRAPLVGTDGQPPLRGYFDEVCFAILEDHNSQHAANPNGNLLPFIHAFKDVPNTSVPRLRGSDDGERDGA